MKVIVNYSIKNVSADAVIIKKYFECFDRNTTLVNDILFVDCKEEEYNGLVSVDDFYIDNAIDDCAKLLTLLKCDFVLNGVIDTSSEAGEYLDFCITVQNGSYKLKKSDWYLETSMDSYESYEDFCENFFKCSKEDYLKFKDYEYVYLLKSRDGEVLVTEVPLYGV